MKKDDLPEIPIDISAVKNLQDLRLRESNGEILDRESREALRALSLANQIINSVMGGGQVDPVFIKKIIQDLNKSFDQPKPATNKIIKKKKLFSKKN